MGELFNSPHEWTPLITERLIDYIRIHISQAGGLTPVRKVAILCEQFGVKTAWHGPWRRVAHRPRLQRCTWIWPVPTSEFRRAHHPRVEAEIFKGCPTYKEATCGPAMLPVGASRWMKRWPPRARSVGDATT